MRIAILGTRGIPNFHGGFEQFAEFFSVYMADKGHEVYVYNSHNHPYKKSKFKNVNIIHCNDPEQNFGTAGQFIYDFNCIVDSRKRKYDIILQLGYTSSSVWSFLFPKKSLIVTNMDGLEWKRSKYNKGVQKFLKYAEKIAVNNSHFLISDSIGIQDYIKNKYHKNSEYIPYGAEIFNNSDNSLLEEFGLEAYNYNMLIARLEPENNIETILAGVTASSSTHPTLVIGKHNTSYGNFLKQKFKRDKRVRFLGGIYDINKLNNLRYFSNIYFHGHSVGGTNPSLLEAMSSNALIMANDNIFNKSILGANAFYFKSAEDIQKRMNISKLNHKEFLSENKKKVKDIYSWSRVNRQYETFLSLCLDSNDKKLNTY